MVVDDGSTDGTPAVARRRTIFGSVARRNDIYLEELSPEFPLGILELFSLAGLGLGAKKIKALWRRSSLG